MWLCHQKFSRIVLERLLLKFLHNYSGLMIKVLLKLFRVFIRVFQDTLELPFLVPYTICSRNLCKILELFQNPIKTCFWDSLRSSSSDFQGIHSGIPQKVSFRISLGDPSEIFTVSSAFLYFSKNVFCNHRRIYMKTHKRSTF